MTLSAVLVIAAAVPQRRVSLRPEDQQPAEQNYNFQPDYRPAKPIEDFRPRVELETSTFIPIIRFDKEQGTDGSYKTA